MNGEKLILPSQSPPYNLGNNAKLRGYNGDGKGHCLQMKSQIISHKKNIFRLCLLGL